MARLVFFTLLSLLICACASREDERPTRSLPWNASIGRLDSIKEGVSCTATLIRPDMIVTAAHCIFSGQRQADLGQMRFTPYVGFKPALPSARISAILKFGGEIHGESKEFHRTRDDWAILRLSDPIDYLKPIPIAAYSVAQLNDLVKMKNSIHYIGYGTYGISAGWRQHVRSNCHLAQQDMLYKEIGPDSVLTDCQVIKGDSGGPILLLQSNGEYQLIGVLSGFWHLQAQNITYSFGALATNFHPFLLASQPQP